jgi:hypothetical protein
MKDIETLSQSVFETWTIAQESETAFRLVRYHKSGNQTSKRFKSAADARDAWTIRGHFPIVMKSR